MNHLMNYSSIWFSADGLASYRSSLHAALLLSLSGLCSTIHQGMNPGIPKQHDRNLSNWTNIVFHPGDGFYSRLCPTRTSQTPLNIYYVKFSQPYRAALQSLAVIDHPVQTWYTCRQPCKVQLESKKETYIFCFSASYENRGPLPAPGLNQQV